LLETRFWEHVETDTPPPADGSESSARALRHLYRDKGTVLDFTGNADLERAFDALVTLRAELEAKGQEAERFKQPIQQAMGGAGRACFSRGEVTYKGAKDSITWDVKRLASDHPDLAAQYLVAKPGARRFVVTPHSAA
jgi:predicted phage-related endonuclease